MSLLAARAGAASHRQQDDGSTSRGNFTRDLPARDDICKSRRSSVRGPWRYRETAKCARRFLAQAVSRGAGVERALLAVGDRGQPVGGHAQARQVVARGLRAALAEGQVVLDGARARRSGPRREPWPRRGSSSTARCAPAIARAWSVSSAWSYSKWMSSSGPPSPLESDTAKSSPSAESGSTLRMSGAAVDRLLASGHGSGLAPRGPGGHRGPALLASAGGQEQRRRQQREEQGQKVTASQHMQSPFIAVGPGPQSGCSFLPGPAGSIGDVACPRDRRRDLPLGPAPAGEREMPAVGRPGRILAAPAPLRDLPDLARRQVDDRDLEAALDARRVGDLGELLGGVPRRPVVVAADGASPGARSGLRCPSRRSAACRARSDVKAISWPVGLQTGAVSRPGVEVSLRAPCRRRSRPRCRCCRRRGCWRTRCACRPG